MSEGGIKDASYIAGEVRKEMDKLDPNGELFDVVAFDGASNVQKAARILEAHRPNLFVIHAVEHAVSLFVADIAKIPQVSMSQ